MLIDVSASKIMFLLYNPNKLYNQSQNDYNFSYLKAEKKKLNVFNYKLRV